MIKRTLFHIFDFLVVTCLFFSLGLLALSLYRASEAQSSADEYKSSLEVRVQDTISNAPDLREFDLEKAKERGADYVSSEVQKFNEVNTQNSERIDLVRNISIGLSVYFALLLLIIIIRARKKGRKDAEEVPEPPAVEEPQHEVRSALADLV